MLPKNSLVECRKESDNLFTKFEILNNSLLAKIDTICIQSDRLEAEKDRIIRLNNCDSAFLKDFKATEQRLREIFIESASLYTEKELLKSLRKTLIDSLNPFSDTGNTSAKDQKLREFAMKTSLYNNSINIEGLFEYYYDIIEINENLSSDKWKLFYKIKLYKFICDARDLAHSTQLVSQGNEWQTELETRLGKLPKPDLLRDLKKENETAYLQQLLELVGSYDVLSYIKKGVEESYSLRNRKTVLLKSIELFTRGEYELFNNLITIQMEGIFNDFLYDAETMYKYKNLNPGMYEKPDLKNKIKHIDQSGTNIYLEAEFYFNYYFNNLIRNPIAHGNYDRVETSGECEEHVFSVELLLDLNLLIFLVSNEAESQKIRRFITSFYNRSAINKLVHTKLLSELNEETIHSTPNCPETPNPIRTVLWIVNPYFEPIYEYFGL